MAEQTEGGNEGEGRGHKRIMRAIIKGWDRPRRGHKSCIIQKRDLKEEISRQNNLEKWSPKLVLHVIRQLIKKL